jgi:hypothetical protein
LLSALLHDQTESKKYNERALLDKEIYGKFLVVLDELARDGMLETFDMLRIGKGAKMKPN